MRKLLFTVGIVAIASILATSAFAQNNGHRGATFTPLGFFPTCDVAEPGEFCDDRPLHTVNDMNGDGSQISGLHAFFSGGYLWDADNGNRTLGPVIAGVYQGRTNGRVASDYFDDTFSWDWSANWVSGFYPDTIWDRIPLTDGFAPCGGSGLSMFGASDNYLTGLTWTDENGDGSGCEGAQAYAWSEAAGTYILDNTVSGDGSYRGNAVSDDGLVTGWSAPGRTASAWIDGIERYICGDIANGTDETWFCNEGWDITPSGSHIAYTGAGPEDFNVRGQIVNVATGDNITLPFPPAPGDPQWDTLSVWAISDDGKTAVGEFGGGGFFGSPPYPVVWVEGIGTIDLQVMLLGQGLDDLFFWFLEDATAVNSDGTIIAGSGFNPDGWIESYMVDIARVKVCHKPGEGNERTLSIGWGGVADHLNHGDVLATCEFAASDAASRFATRRQQVSSAMSADADGRMRSLDAWNKISKAVGGQQIEPGSTPAFTTKTPTDNSDETRKVSNPDQQRKSLYNRLDKRVDRR